MEHATVPEIAVLQYTIAPACLDEHLELVAAVYGELDAVRPPDFSWSTYRIDGTRDFVEVAVGNPLPGPLPELASFRRYRAGLEARCEARRFDTVTVVGSYSNR